MVKKSSNGTLTTFLLLVMTYELDRYSLSMRRVSFYYIVLNKILASDSYKTYENSSVIIPLLGNMGANY